MPTVPEPLPPPKSLGGLLNFTESEETESEGPILGLIERTNELTEDIEERREVADAIRSIDKESDETTELVASDEIVEDN